MSTLLLMQLKNILVMELKHYCKRAVPGRVMLQFYNCLHNTLGALLSDVACQPVSTRIWDQSRVWVAGVKFIKNTSDFMQCNQFVIFFVVELTRLWVLHLLRLLFVSSFFWPS